MFDIRKVQEKVIYEAGKAESDADTASEVVYGCGQTVHTENNPGWVVCKYWIHTLHAFHMWNLQKPPGISSSTTKILRICIASFRPSDLSRKIPAKKPRVQQAAPRAFSFL